MSRLLDISGTDLTALGRLDAATTGAAANAATRIARLADRVPDGWPIGFERELYQRTLPDISSGVPRGRLRSLDVAFEDNLRVEVLQRPPSEYGVTSLLIAMDHGCIGVGDVKRAVKLMGGTAIERNTIATTLPFASGHRTGFVAPPIALPAFAAMLDGVVASAEPARSLIRATGVYFATTLLHPFIDGNGRAARALFQCVLKADLGMAAPLFPLGPMFEPNKELLLDAKYVWQLDADAHPLVRLVINCVTAYCDILEVELPCR